MKCDQCHGDIAGRGISHGRFCCLLCKSHWHNQNRTLQPNTEYDCIVCGKHVSKYLSPSRKGTIDTMQFCSRTCKGVYQTGDKHPRWKGGGYTDKDGYIYITAKGHPLANKDGQVFEHRLVMESMVGRHLTRREVVHHENGNTSDNRPDNLKLFSSQAKHMKYHDSIDNTHGPDGKLQKRKARI